MEHRKISRVVNPGHVLGGGSRAEDARGAPACEGASASNRQCYSCHRWAYGPQDRKARLRSECAPQGCELIKGHAVRMGVRGRRSLQHGARRVEPLTRDSPSLPLLLAAAADTCPPPHAHALLTAPATRGEARLSEQGRGQSALPPSLPLSLAPSTPPPSLPLPALHHLPLPLKWRPCKCVECGDIHIPFPLCFGPRPHCILSLPRPTSHTRTLYQNSLQAANRGVECKARTCTSFPFCSSLLVTSLSLTPFSPSPPECFRGRGEDELASPTSPGSQPHALLPIRGGDRAHLHHKCQASPVSRQAKGTQGGLVGE